VTVPVATIGIFGTMVAATVGPDKTSTVVLLGPGRHKDGWEKVGRIEVRNSYGAVEIGRSGFGTVIEPGHAPGTPFNIPRSKLDELGILQLSRRPTGRSGSPFATASVNPSKISGHERAQGGGTLEGLKPLANLSNSLDAMSTFITQDLQQLNDGTASWAQ